jgi:hypothetical protein
MNYCPNKAKQSLSKTQGIYLRSLDVEKRSERPLSVKRVKKRIKREAPSLCYVYFLSGLSTKKKKKKKSPARTPLSTKNINMLPNSAWLDSQVHLQARNSKGGKECMSVWILLN